LNKKFKEAAKTGYGSNPGSRGKMGEAGESIGANAQFRWFSIKGTMTVDGGKKKLWGTE